MSGVQDPPPPGGPAPCIYSSTNTSPFGLGTTQTKVITDMKCIASTHRVPPMCRFARISSRKFADACCSTTSTFKTTTLWFAPWTATRRWPKYAKLRYSNVICAPQDFVLNTKIFFYLTLQLTTQRAVRLRKIIKNFNFFILLQSKYFFLTHGLAHRV